MAERLQLQGGDEGCEGQTGLKLEEVMLPSHPEAIYALFLDGGVPRVLRCAESHQPRHDLIVIRNRGDEVAVWL